MNVEKQCEMIIAEALGNLPDGIKVNPTLKVITFRNSPVAGKAQGTNRIYINTDLAEMYPDQLRDTVLHELAHCLVHGNYPSKRKPHGQEWQDMMAILGAPPETCHRMEQPDLVRKRHSRHHYRCGCRDHYLKAGRHNKHICYGVIYKCRSCGTDLELQS